MRLRLAIIGAAAGLANSGCLFIWHLPEVSEPRQGRALHGRLALVYSGRYQISLLGLERFHSFDIHKYARIYTQLVKNGVIEPRDVYVPEPIGEQDVLRVHTAEFLRSLKRSSAVAEYLEAPLLGILPAGFLDSAVLEPFRYATGGTLLAAREALRHGVAINLGGGYHHAGPDAGAGFCVYADMPIAIRTLQAEGRFRRALVIDLDAHQGNGTAICLADDDQTFTFSMHQGDIYPFPKAKSDRDVELEAGTEDSAFLATLSRELPALFDRAKPDIVFYQAGCDTMAGDPITSLQMTGQGIVARDAMVVSTCLGRRVPVLMLLGGGYSRDAWRAQYDSVANIIEVCSEQQRSESNDPD
ncbi:MAG: histone deacetylase [bacterium]|nr:histone deacetylase [bacterium]